MSEFRRPKIEEIENSDNVEKDKEEIEKKQEEIRKQIDEIINNFVNGEKTRENFVSFCRNLDEIRERANIDIKDIEKAWTEEQMGKVIDIFDDDELEIIESRYFDYFYFIAGDGETNPIMSYLNNKILSGAKDNEVSNLMLDAIGKGYVGKYEDNLIGENFTKRLLNTFKNNNSDVNKTIKIIKAAIKISGQGFDAMHGQLYLDHVLDEIGKHDNYFSNLAIKYVRRTPFKDSSIGDKKRMLGRLGYYNGETTEKAIEGSYCYLIDEDQRFFDACVVEEQRYLLEEYHDEDIEKDYLIDPISDYKDNCVYAKLTSRFGVIYNMRGEIDTLFKMDEKNKDNPEEKNLIEILEDEGITKDTLDKKEYLSLINNYQAILELPIRSRVEDEFGIDISDYSVREQLQFVNFLSSRTVAEVEKVKDFLNAAGSSQGKKNRIKSFLSLEMDSKNGERILEIGEKFEPKDSDLVFSKIAELVSWAEREKDELNEELYENKDYEAMAATQKELLRRAHQDIVFFSKNIGGKEGVKDIILRLENRKIETTLLASFLKSLKEQGKEVSFESLKNFELEIKNVLNEEEKTQILKMSGENWERQLPAAKDLVIEGVKSSFEADGQEWYLLKHQEKIAGCFRFERLQDGSIYWGTVNVIDELKGVKIGDGMFEIVKKMGEKENIEATVSLRLPVGCYYIEKLGFVIDGFIDDYHKTGESFFNITLSPKEKKAENEASEEIIKRCGEEELSELVGKDRFIRRYDMAADFSGFQEEIKILLPLRDDNGKIIEGQNMENKYRAVRYFQDKSQKEKDIRYVAFEKI